MINYDCFAYLSPTERIGCNALDKLYCKSGKCKFYKTLEQLSKECDRAGVAIHEDYIKKEEVV